ncbi:ornithine transcarbamylase, mitochondrial-like [Physella acuta]|uniref:ornithine transcarbamylase, mitochondrial-like n=1 Tax=Physella acuta TaxID=109671 RepID=UPI0027DDD709|nr:ornithine transcarbamylase, mitochondrial-like [Physella acuta]
MSVLCTLRNKQNLIGFIHKRVIQNGIRSVFTDKTGEKNKSKSTERSSRLGALFSDIEKDKNTNNTLDQGLKKAESHLVGRDFLSLKHFSCEDIKQFLWTAKDLKTRMKDNGEIFQPLKGKTAALIFQKRSTRTRLSTELGFAKLGGHACFLGPDDIHLGVNESVKDSARVLAGMSDVILARVYGHNVIEEMANEANKPVINGLSDLLHPLQILADFMTLQEHFGYLRGLQIAWIGDGNNILHSLMYGCAKLGIDLNIATPAGYEPNETITSEVMNISGKTGALFKMGTDPIAAARMANVIVTDTWVSMGQEEEKQKRLKDFAGYQIDGKMLKDAGAEWVFLHCLPRKQEEVTDDIFYSKQSLVWQEAENRMWTVMAVMLHLLQPYTPTIPQLKFVK